MLILVPEIELIEDWFRRFGIQYIHAALAMNEGSVAPDYAPGPVWVIFDSAAVTRQKWNVTPPVVDIAGGYFFVADTLEEQALGPIQNPVSGAIADSWMALDAQTPASSIAALPLVNWSTACW